MVWMIDVENKLLHQCDVYNDGKRLYYNCVCGTDSATLRVFAVITDNDACEAKGFEPCVACQLIQVDISMRRSLPSGASSVETSDTTTPPQKFTIFEPMSGWRSVLKNAFQCALLIIAAVPVALVFIADHVASSVIMARRRSCGNKS